MVKSIKQAITEYPECSILKDDAKLWNMIIYLGYTGNVFKMTPVDTLMCRFGLDESEVKVLAELLNYSIETPLSLPYTFLIPKEDSFLGKDEKVIMKETDAQTVVDLCITTGASLPTVLKFAQDKGVVPYSIFTQYPDIAASVTVTGMCDMGKNVRLSYEEQEVQDMLLQDCIWKNISDGMMYLDPANALILPVAELGRLRKMNEKYYVDELSKIFCLPVDILQAHLGSLTSLQQFETDKYNAVRRKEVAEKPEPTYAPRRKESSQEKDNSKQRNSRIATLKVNQDMVKAERIRDEILKLAPPSVIDAVDGSKWHAAMLCAQAYFKVMDEDAVLDKQSDESPTEEIKEESTKDILQRCFSISIFRDNDMLWNLLIYLYYGHKCHSGVPVEGVMARYGLTRKQVSDIAKILHYNEYPISGGHVLLRPDTVPYDYEFKNIGRVDNYAQFIVRTCVETGITSGYLIGKAQKASVVPKSIWTSNPYLGISLTQQVLMCKYKCLASREFEESAVLRGYMLQLMEQNCLFRVIGSEKYFVSPDNPLAMHESEFIRLRSMVGTNSPAYLAVLFAMPETLIEATAGCGSYQEYSKGMYIDNPAQISRSTPIYDDDLKRG